MIIYNELALDHSDNEPALDHSDNEPTAIYIVDEFCEASKNPWFSKQKRQLGASYWGFIAKSLKIIEKVHF